MVNRIELDFVKNLHRVGKSLRHILEDLVHLLRRFKPLLLGVVHSRLAETLLHRHAYQPVMCLGILLVCEMHIICGHHFYAMLLTHLEQEVIHFNLKRICVAVGIFLKCKMPLEFKVIIIAKSLFIPKNPFLGRLQVVMNHKLRHISTYASRTHYQPFGMESKLLTVCARLIIVTVSPCLAHEFNKVVITLIVFARTIRCVPLSLFVFPVGHLLRHIHFTADNRLELLFIGLSSVLFYSHNYRTP